MLTPMRTRPTVRPAVVLLALVAGLAAVVLGFLASADVPTAALVGSGATGSALQLFHGLLGGTVPAHPTLERPMPTIYHACERCGGRP